MKRYVCACLTAVLLLGLLLPFSGCSASADLRPSSHANKVVATAGDVEIYYDELYYLAMSRIKELKAELGENALDDPAVKAELEAFVRENLLTRSHALIEVAKDFGIEIDKGELASEVDAHMENLLAENFEGDRDAYAASLNESFLTDRYVRTYVAVEEYLATYVITEMLQRGSLDASDETALSYIKGDDVMRVYQVLIETRNYVSAEKALAKATELQAKVAAQSDAAAREKEMRLAMQFSTYIDDGNGLYFARGEMEEGFESAAFALQEYGVSEVLAVEGGYSFVMRFPKDEAYMTENFNALKQKAYYVTLNKLVEEKLATLQLSMTEYGSSLDLAALPEIDADGGSAVYTAVVVGVCVLLAAGVGAVLYFLLRKNAGKFVKSDKKSHR